MMIAFAQHSTPPPAAGTSVFKWLFGDDELKYIKAQTHKKKYETQIRCGVCDAIVKRREIVNKQHKEVQIWLTFIK